MKKLYILITVFACCFFSCKNETNSTNKDTTKNITAADSTKIALVTQDGLLGELLKLTKTYINGDKDNLDKLITTHDLCKNNIREEFIVASQWCQDLDL